MPSLALGVLVHLAALMVMERSKVETKTSRPTHRRTDAARPRSAPVASTAVAPPATVATVPEAAPATVVTLDTSSTGKRARMLAYLDEHPNASGAELDAAFDTKNYGRSVRRAWLSSRQPQASGE
jgi:hypothetical protein